MGRKSRQEFEAQKPEDRLGDQPIEEQYHNQMTAMMRTLDEFMNGENAVKGKRTVGIVLMVFPYNDHSGRCNYISNGANRKDIVTLMKEMIARFEGQPEAKGSA